MEGRWKWWEDEKEDVSSYWMTLRKRQDTGSWKRKHRIALRWELTLEEAVDVSSDRLRNEILEFSRPLYDCPQSFNYWLPPVI